MGQYVDGNTKSFLNGTAAIAKGTRVVETSGVLAVAGITDKELGVTIGRIEANVHGAVRLRSAAGTSQMIANAALSAGADVFTAAAGKVAASASTAYLIGEVLEASAADGDLVEVLRHNHAETAVV